MIVNIATPHVILFKDYLYYDDINEFLKRPYKTQESKHKMKDLIEYYEKDSANVFPTLSTIVQSKIMMKRYANMYVYHDKNMKLSGV